MTSGNYCSLKRREVVLVASIYLRGSFEARWETRQSWFKFVRKKARQKYKAYLLAIRIS